MNNVKRKWKIANDTLKEKLHLEVKKNQLTKERLRIDNKISDIDDEIKEKQKDLEEVLMQDSNSQNYSSIVGYKKQDDKTRSNF